MILTPPSGVNLIHILFTPGICPPGLRLQIRNHDPTSQEKTGTLFCLSAQKNLDAKSSLALRPVSLGASCLVDENVVRRRPGGSVIDRILVCFGRPRITQKGSPRREFARNSDTKKAMRRFREISPIRLGAVREAGDLLFHLARRLPDRAAGLVDRHPGRLDMAETSRAFRRSRAAQPRRAFIADDSRSVASADRSDGADATVQGRSQLRSWGGDYLSRSCGVAALRKGSAASRGDASLSSVARPPLRDL